MARRWGRRLLVGWVGVLAILLALPLLDLSFARFVPILQALWGAWLLAAICTVPLLLWQRVWPALAVLVLASVTGLVPILTAGSPADAAGDGDLLTVLSVNTEFSGADPDAVAEAVAAVDADVLVLLEVGDAYLDRLRRTGIADRLRHGWDRPASGGAGGTAVLSGVPQHDPTTYADEHDYRFDLPLVALDVDGTEVLLRAVHTQPPAPAPAGPWRRELAALGDWVEQVPDDRLLVLAGDFNAGRVHPAFREVVDDLAVAPSVAARTWPAGGVLPPFVGIDHLAAQGLAPLASGVVEVPGTDHRAVWARLARTG